MTCGYRWADDSCSCGSLLSNHSGEITKPTCPRGPRRWSSPTLVGVRQPEIFSVSTPLEAFSVVLPPKTCGLASEYFCHCSVYTHKEPIYIYTRIDDNFWIDESTQTDATAAIVFQPIPQSGPESTRLQLRANVVGVYGSKGVLQEHEDVLERVAQLGREQTRFGVGEDRVGGGGEGPVPLGGAPPWLALDLPLARELRRQNVLRAARVGVQPRDRVRRREAVCEFGRQQRSRSDPSRKRKRQRRVRTERRLPILWRPEAPGPGRLPVAGPELVRAVASLLVVDTAQHPVVQLHTTTRPKC
ncbi:hypothetical protein B296_00002213 [Ensete ventricosum]|uniref:Uncharacterized protein n=1 Tax=Ensete ventricosum TaxID=4639 RepID=A0A427B4R1_ENSVE|nr:hypothetical protein B296_00002213 [Ensete ventricosum]